MNSKVKATHPRKVPQIISVWSCVCKLMEDEMPPLTGDRQQGEGLLTLEIPQIISVWSCECKLMEDGMPPLTGDRQQGEGYSP